MAITQYKFFAHSNSISYKKYDVILDAPKSRYYYATQDNVGQNVSGNYNYVINSWSRSNDLITAFYTKTGAGPNFAQGSLIVATGHSDPNAYYTGMVIDATPTYITYIGAGQDLVVNTPGGQINTVMNPCWTTGFFFAPSYATSFEKNTKTLSAQFGDGYSQRQRDGINSNSNTINANFENRTDKETKALLNFIEDKGGVESFKILMPVSTINNSSDIKYIGVSPKVNTQNYNSNTINLVLTQVFDK